MYNVHIVIVLIFINLEREREGVFEQGESREGGQTDDHKPQEVKQSSRVKELRSHIDYADAEEKIFHY